MDIREKFELLLSVSQRIERLLESLGKSPVSLEDIQTQEVEKLTEEIVQWLMSNLLKYRVLRDLLVRENSARAGDSSS